MIGTLSRKAAEAGCEVVIVSSDKDMLQLVTDRVSMLNPAKDDTWYDPAKVKEFMGVEPRQVADLLALKGDAIDNIPGRAGHRRQGRARSDRAVWLACEAALDRADEVTRKMYRESLQNNRERILLSLQLATIHCDVPVPFELEELPGAGAGRGAAEASLQRAGILLAPEGTGAFGRYAAADFAPLEDDGGGGRLCRAASRRRRRWRSPFRAELAEFGLACRSGGGAEPACRAASKNCERLWKTRRFRKPPCDLKALTLALLQSGHSPGGFRGRCLALRFSARCGSRRLFARSHGGAAARSAPGAARRRARALMSMN